MSPSDPDGFEPVQFPLSRRALIGGAAIAGAAFALGGAALLGTSNAFAAAAASADFLRLSEFLTGGQPLEPGLATRYQAALARHDAKFGEAWSALQRYVADSKETSVDSLLARADLGEPLRKTITQIVSAWYLGIVGNDVDAELISYAQALMYRPTQDVLVIPTYGGGPDSWGRKPAGVVAPSTEKAA
ncbi:sugar dehydrogenase complex small subunit [Ideonella sp.]|uniref:sugar dehydrogenase complex small subunit n=1 Tax=Ideonella sp. TaxID=1929293 RepID=UPI00351BCE83